MNEGLRTKLCAVIFDMDGLMVDTEPLAQQAWEAVLADFGVSLDAALYRRMIGHRTEQSAQMVLEHYELPLPVAELVRRKTDLFTAIRRQGVPAMPGLQELLAVLARLQIPWGVATSSPRAHAVEILQQLELSQVCRAIAAGDEVRRGKPAPDLYLLAAERMRVLPACCLALEDSAPGCRAALAAGMRVFAVPNAHTRSADFPPVTAVFASLHEVIGRL